jgi:uncharacterized protein (UPF0335 family)
MTIDRIVADQLKSFIERIERLQEEGKVIRDDIKGVYAEAKSNGYDVPTIRKIIKIRAQDAGERREAEAILETYMHALGIGPLFEQQAAE